MDAQGLLGDDHGEVGGAGGHVARAGTDGVGGRHAGAGVALAGGDRDAGTQGAGGVQEPGAGLRQRAALLPRCQHLGENITQRNARQGVELLHHGLVIVAAGAVDGEHAAGLPHAHHLFPGELPVDIARQSGEIGDVFHMCLAVQNGLVQVGDAPALGDIEAEEGGQLLRRRAGDGVAPGAERGKLAAVLTKGQVAVHHGADADGAHGGQLHAELGFHIGFQLGKAGLQAGVHHVHGVRPDAVLKLILPLEIPLGDGAVTLVDEHGLDAGRAQLDTQCGFCQIHPIFYLIH